MPPSKSDIEILQAALVGLQHQAGEIGAKMAEIHARIAGGERPLSPEPAEPKKRVLSAAGRRRIAAAQRKRWAEYRKAARPGEVAKKASKSKPYKKHELSPEAKQRISEANKKRWAEFRIAKAASANRTAQETPSEAPDPTISMGATSS